MANPNPKTEHLIPWHFKKGQVSNPWGRQGKGKSMKERAKEMLRNMTDEEAEEYLSGLNKLDIWKMAEGNPTEEQVGKQEFVLHIEEAIAKKHGITSDTNESSGK